jgi:hypothetical protein
VEKVRTLEFFAPDKRNPDGLGGGCRTCTRVACRESNRKWREANRERAREKYRKWAAANPGKVCERVRKWREANPESIRESNRKWREANPESIRESNRKYRAANPEKDLAKCSKRRAIKRAALDPSANHSAIAEIFDTAKLAEAFTGKPFAVDHIIPLARGGKHHEDNLRHLPARLNGIKHDKLDCEVTDIEFKRWTSGANVFEQVTYRTFINHNMRSNNYATPVR